MATHLTTIVSALVLLAVVQSKQSNLISCNGASTCRECLQLSSICTWCASQNITQHRCEVLSNIQAYCPSQDIQNPSTSAPEFIRNDAVQDKIGLVGPIQVSPQEISLKIRPGQPVFVNITVRPSRDYPVDMYFVMDLSHSMNDDLETMKSVIGELATAMEMITTDFQLGFGSFVDKTVSPFIREIYLENENPCIYLSSYRDDVCDTPYGFRNIFPLSQQIDTFQALLASLTKSLSSDRPEGGLDGLMQATVCKEQIGWRADARHFIIYMSDADFHIALDGKIGKITTPNDGKCHLSQTGFYTNVKKMDYPSIGQLSSKMKKQNIIPIFAISKGEFYNDIPFYQNLVNQFFESGKVASLAIDSSNIIQLVSDSYEQITSEVRMEDTAKDPIQVKYTSYCGSEITANSKECLHVVSQQAVTFVLEINVKSQKCLTGPTTFIVKPDGFSEEVLIHVDTLCNCGCESNSTLNALQCSGGNGTDICGVCECSTGRYGENCECDLNGGTALDSAACIGPSSTIPCSSQGTCICGKCLCNEESPNNFFYGQYCECRDSTCGVYDDLKCGGDTRGRCECGQCICEPGYTKSDCRCPPNDTCIAQNGKECNGFGECICGKCTCFQNSSYDGDTCENCDIYTCFQSYCDEKVLCVLCTMYGDGSEKDKQCAADCEMQYVFSVEDLTSDVLKNETCEYIDVDNCVVTFTFFINDTATYITVNSEIACQEKSESESKIDHLLIIGIILGILLAGLAAIFIWRMLTFIYDRREYARFEKELNKSTKETSENPLFKSSTTSYRNPMYGQ